MFHVLICYHQQLTSAHKSVHNKSISDVINSLWILFNISLPIQTNKPIKYMLTIAASASYPLVIQAFVPFNI